VVVVVVVGLDVVVVVVVVGLDVVVVVVVVSVGHPHVFPFWAALETHCPTFLKPQLM